MNSVIKEAFEKFCRKEWADTFFNPTEVFRLSESGDYYKAVWIQEKYNWFYAGYTTHQEAVAKPTEEDLGHHIRFSDSSLYDLRCVKCGATDASGDDGLKKPCPRS